MARKQRGIDAATLIGAARRSRGALLLSTALQASAFLVLAMPARAQAPNARPQGGVVVGGSATISTSATNTQVTQGSQSAIVNWNSFNVGQNQSVTFAQPNSSAIVLNRVNAAQPSEIAGRISANGQVVIENRSGVIFANSADVNASSLLVTASGITNKNFMAGKMIFNIPGNPNAQVINKGHITVKDTGLVALVAPSVANSGVIQAKLGTVVLAGARTATVDLYGDGLLSVDVTSEVKQAPIGPNGKPVQVLVTNTGTISAAGGTVLLTAQAADGIVSNLVEAGGHISANSVGSKTGTISIAGIGGSIEVDGLVSANGKAPGTTGGQVQLTATNTVTVGAKARISASGKAGGGTVAIGTTLARANGGSAVTPTVVAQNTIIQKGAKISANATRNGNGGRVTVLSTQQTTMAGSISARGGKIGGNGGSVEVSGDLGYALTGSVNVAAPFGTPGSILIDPTNLVIASGGTGVLSSGSSPAGAGNATIDPSAFANLTGNVTLDAANDLTVSSGFTANAANLLLQAGHDLKVNAPIALNGSGTITLSAAVGTSAFTSATGYDPVNGPNGVLTIASTGGVTASSGTLLLNSGAGGIVVNGPVTVDTLTANTIGGFTVGGTVATTNATVTAGSITVASAGSLSGTTVTLSTAGGTIAVSGALGATGTLSLKAGTSITEGGTITAGTLTGSAITAAFTGTNAVGTLGDFATSGNFSLTNGGSLIVAGTITAGSSPYASNSASIALATASGDLLLSSGEINAGTVSLSAGGDVTQSGAVVNTGTLIVPKAVDVSLANANNTIATLGATTFTGNLTIADASALNVTSAIDATGTGEAVSLTATGGLTLTQGITADGNISLTALPGSAGSSIDIASAVTSNNGSVYMVGGTGGVTIDAPITALGHTISITGDFISRTDDTVDTLDAGSTGTVEMAPASAIAVTLGTPLSAGGFGVDVTGVTAGTLRIGAATTASDSTPVVTARSITVPLTGFDATGFGVLDLETTGAITQLGNLTNVNELTGNAQSVSLGGTLTTDIASLGNFTTSQDFSLQDNEALTILGLVEAAGTHTLALNSAGDITIGQTGTAAALNGGTVSLQSGGDITEIDGTITADALLVPSAGTLTLSGANMIGALGAVNASADITLTDGEGLTILGDVAAGATNTLALNVTGDLTIGQTGTAGALNAGTVSLSGTGAITEQNGTIGAGLLTIPTAGTVTLGDNNAITDLGAASSTNGFSLTNAQDLTVLGTVAAGNAATLGLNVTGNLAIGQAGTAGALNAGTVSLSGTGAITEQNGTIGATLLTIPTAGTVTLGGNNAITDLGAASSTNGFSLTNAQDLTVLGTVTAGNAATLGLNVTGNLTIGQTGTAGALNAGTVSLSGTGAITEQNGTISAGLLTIPTAGTVTLGGNNAITDLGASSSTNGFSLTNAQDLTVLGTVTAGNAATLGLNVTGNLTIGQTGTAGALNAGTVSLSGTGAITEQNGTISAALLTIPMAGTVTLGGNNAITDLGASSSTIGFSLTNAQDLTVLGTVTAGNAATLGLNVTGNLTIGQGGTAGALNAGTVSLSGTGAITEQNGTIGATLLTIPTAGTVTLGGNNAITDLGAASSTNGFSLTNAQDLTVLGAVTAGNAATLGLNVTGNLTIGQAGTVGALNAGTVSLTASGAIDEPNGTISAGLLTIPTAGTVTLGGNNVITDLGAASSTNGFSLTNAQDLTVLGTVTAGNAATLGLNVTGNLAIGQAGTAGALNAGTVSLTASGAIDEPNGTISATTLLVPSASAVTLGGANMIAQLGTVGSAGDVSLVDGEGLTILGSATAASGGLLSLTVDGDLTIGQAGTAGVLSGGTIALIASGAITEPNGTITAALLTGPNSAAAETSATSVDLTSSTNTIAALGTFTTSGNFTLNDITALDVASTVTVGGGQTLELIAPGLTIPGTLIANAASTVTGGNTVVTPGAVLLQTDTFSLTGSIEAPAGLVAIAPLTAGHIVSVDATSVAGHLSLLASDLARINTIYTVGGSDIAIFGDGFTPPGPTGTQTLMLGSLDGTTSTAGAVVINTGLDLTGIANTLAIYSTGDFTANGALTVQALTGSVGGNVALTNPNNAISYLGNTIIRGGFSTNSALSGGFSAGGNFALTDSAGLAVVGLVQAGAGDTLSLNTPSLVIDARNLPTDALAPGDDGANNAGTLSVADAISVNNGTTTVTPGVIQIATDALQILGTATSGTIVNAPGGTVAIAPRTAGDTMSIDTVRANTVTNLSLTTADLSYIDTVATTLLPAGLAGTQTLMLGSLGGQTLIAGDITINAPVAFGTATVDAGGAPIVSTGNAATLALYSNGTISEGASGSITVNTLVAVAGIAPGAATATAPGNITLGGANLISALGDTASTGSFQTASPARGVSASGNILIADGMDLTVTAGTTVQAGLDPTLAFHPGGAPASLEIDVSAAPGIASGNLTVAGTVIAGFDDAGTVGLGGNVILRAGSDSVAGALSIPGTVYAEAGTGGGNVTLSAGYDSTFTLRNASCAAGSCAITIAGTVAGNANQAASSVALKAGGQIAESGNIRTSTLNVAAGYAADLRGASQAANQIAFLSGFDSNLAGTGATVANGFGGALEDGSGLTTTGMMDDHGGTGIEVTVAGPGNSAADLVLGAGITTGSSATVKLEATGNIYEQPGAIITTGTLTGEAGFVPETAGGVAPGTLPGGASLQPVSLASAVFGQANQIGTLGNFSATDSVVIANAGSLTVAGTILAGAATGLPATTPPFTLLATIPTVDIRIASGMLNVGGTIEAGFAGYSTGTVTLAAGNSLSQGGISILAGGAVGAQSGATVLMAGVSGDPTTAGATYFTACGTCTISIAGAIGPQAQQNAKGMVGLYAVNGITETGQIAATTLQGQAGIAPSVTGTGVLASASLTGAAPTSNTIDTLGDFAVSGGFTLNDDAPLTVSGTLAAGTAATTTPGVGSDTFDVSLNMPGNALTVTGAITDGVAAAGTTAGTDLAGGNITLGAGSLTIGGLVSAPGGTNGGGTITTTTSGTISETGTLVAGTLTGSASAASFTGTNSIATLDGFTTSGDFALNDSAALTVLGAVQTGNAATLALTVNGNLALGNTTTAATLSAGTVALDAAGDITEPNGVITANLLTGPSTGLAYTSANSATLDNAANAIATLGSFATSGNFDLVDSRSLTVLGRVAAGGTSTLGLTVNGDLAIGQTGTAGTLSAGIVQLDTPGAITEPNGAIIATTLTGSAASTSLGGANSIATLDGFTTSGDFALNDNEALTVLGTLQVGTAATLTLTVNGNLTLGNPTTAATLSAGTVALDAAGDITEPNGTITAALLTGPSTGLAYTSANSATLDNAANAIATLGSFATTGNFDLVDSRSLTVLGRVAAGNSATLGLTVNGALAIGQTGTAGTLSAGIVQLDTPGAITEPNGAIIATTLIGPHTGLTYTSATSANLGGANSIATLDGFTTSGDFALNDVTDLTIAGALLSGSNIVLSANTLTIPGTVAATGGGTVTTIGSGTISETGTLIAGTLTGSAGAASFTGATPTANSIGTLAGFTTGQNFLLNDGSALLVAGTVSAGGVTAPNAGNTAQLTLAANGALTIGNAGTASLLNAGTVTLLSPAAITEPNGVITANLLTGSTTGATYTAASAVTLGGANAIAELGNFASTGGFALTSTQGLTIIGLVGAGSTSTLALTANGDLTIGTTGAAGALDGGTVTILAPGNITEPNGSISAATLIGPQTGLTYTTASSASLNGNNTVGTLAGFVTSGGFALNDNAALTVLGALQAGTTDTLALTVNGNLALGNPGTAALINAGTVSLIASGDITEPNGSITANLLTGPTAGQTYTQANSATLDSSTNSIATLGSFTTSGNFDLVDSRSLTVLGSVAASGTSTLGLTMNGALAIGQSGTAGTLSAGTVQLDTPGAITEPNGAIIATTLIGPHTGLPYTSAASANLGGANSIATLAGFTTSGDFALNDNAALTVLGAVQTGNAATLALTVNGDLALGNTSAAATLNAGTVVLDAAGDITEPNGTITATLLTGPSTGLAYATANAATLDNAANAIASLGGFATSGNFDLVDNRSLTVLGGVAAGTSATLGLTVNGDLAIGQSGTAGTLSAGTVQLDAAGAITEPNGAIFATTLTGSAASANLAGTNSIATLDGFTTSGDFTLNDTTGLTVLGALQAGGVLAPNPANTATLTLLVNGALTIGLNGEAAALNAGTVALVTSGGINEVNGSIGANLLTGATPGAAYASASGTISLTGAGNAFATLGGMASSGDILLQDATSLAVAGPLTAGDSVVITDHGALSIGNSITGSNGVILTADQSISQTHGAILAGAGGISLSANGGAITQSAGATISDWVAGAPISLIAANGIAFGGAIGGDAPMVTLNAGIGGITETSGSGVLDAGLLTGAAGGSVVLDNGQNSIANLAAFSSGGSFLLADQNALGISGNVIAAGGLNIADSNSIAQNAGAIQASQGGVTLAANAGFTQSANALVTAIASNGTVTIDGGSGIDIGGTIAATGATAVVTLASSGPIGETGTGHVDATRLIMSSDSNAMLDNTQGGGNLVATLGAASAAGMLGLADAMDLTVAGPVSGNAGITLATTGNMILPNGTRISSAAGPVTLTSGGTFTQASGGAVVGNTVTIEAPGAVNLAGTLSGGRILVSGPGNDPAGQVTLQSGAVIVTGSAGSFQQTTPFGALPTRNAGAQGAYFYTQNFLESGGATVTGLNGNPASTFRIDTIGDALFDPTNGLAASGTTLIMNILGTGTVSGNMTVKALFVNYPVGVTASANLSGSVNGLTGQTAAEAAAISPRQNSQFRFNSCPIGSVNCIVLPVESVPPLNPNQNLDIGNFQNSDDDSDLLLPNVSDQDY